MESKKASMFASLMDDDSDGPGATHFRPPSPFPDDGSVNGAESGAALGSNSLAVPQQPLSCVTKETFQEDCARHRFIVWAAVKRNSNPRMKPEEKLRCPLLKCTRQFADHESMLKHLAGCAYLATGEYLCYDHMRVERFDDLKCKRCLGHPSKRKKMLSMAKNFFHSLGHKSKKGQLLGSDINDSSLLLPPPSYDSLGIPPPTLDVTELSSTEICEIDSTEVSAVHYPATTDVDAINPQALLVPLPPHLPELDSAMPPSDPFAQWQPPQMMNSPFPFGYPDEYGARNPGPKPTLQVNTHGLPARRHVTPRPAPRPALVVSRSKGLSPSSSVRSTASTDTTASTSSNVSSLVSPASNWSGAWSMPSGVNTSLTSPIEGFGPFADSAFDNQFLSSLHELPADIPLCKAEVMAADPLAAFQDPQSNDAMFATDLIVADVSTPMIDMDDSAVGESNVCCSETKSVVGSAWDALQEHLVSSTLKIQHVKGNHLADQLKQLSITTIASSGLRTLRTLLNGGQPSSALDTLCFVHLMYAFSLAVHEKGASSKSKQFFLQSLSYASSLPPNDRPAYTELSFCIWQPPDVGQVEISDFFAQTPHQSPSRSSSLKGKDRETRPLGYGHDDSLLNAARDFLDELEMSLVMGQIPSSLEVQSSELYAKHIQEVTPIAVNRAFATTVNYMLTLLNADFHDVERLKDKLMGVGQRANDGTISSVRRAEIEMLFAGKECMSTMRFFDSYTPEVRNLCDQIYSQHDAGTARRDIYHQAGISLIEKLIPEFDKSMGEPLLDIHDDLDEFFDSLTGDNAMMPFTLNMDGPTSESSQVPAMFATPAATPAGVSSSTEQQVQDTAKAESSEQQDHKVEAYSKCDLCDYRPKGDPQWFKGSMAKHKKLQHSTDPPKIFKCPFPGCSSQYRNRPDNLRQHQIEKNHWVKGEEATPRRPSKRKKVDTDE